MSDLTNKLKELKKQLGYTLDVAPRHAMEKTVKHLKQDISLLDDIIEDLANGDNASDSGLHLQRVSHRIDFEKLRQAYFNECVEKTNGKSKLYVCLAPHDLFEWFRKEIIEYGG